MEEYSVIISEHVIEQVKKIYNYIANQLCNPLSATKISKGLYSMFLSLNRFPERYKIVDLEDFREREIRSAYYKRYCIYYYIDGETNIVYVLSVVHESRQQDYRLVINDKLIKYKKIE